MTLTLDPPQLRDHADVTRGLEDRHRRVYALIIGHPHGLTREQLAERSGLGDRQARKTVEELRIVAACIPHKTLGCIVIGYDPDQQIYTYAKSRAQADAIMRFHASYARKIIAVLDAQEAAARTAFGESESREVQEVLFDARAVLASRVDWRRG